MPSLSARTLRRRPDLMAGRAWRATIPGSASTPSVHGTAVLLVLLAFSFLYVLVGRPEAVPWSVFLPLIVLSGVIHRPAEHGLVVGVSLGCLAVAAVLVGSDTPHAVGTLVVGMLISTVTSWRCLARARVGVQGTGGELLLGQLRAGLERRAELPQLRPGWTVEGCISSAFGHPFSGDFIVSHLDDDAGRFEVVLVDVSGKGIPSASRAVQLSGALDALIGSVPPEELLALANDFVVRQEWAEGFATAVHVAVDLDTGEFRVWRAGHPPAAVFHGGSGNWSLLQEGVGPALGLVPAPVYCCDEGVLRRRDALILYSDGLVEQHDRVLDEGIDRLLGKAEFLVATGFVGGARRLCEQATSGDTDDRSVVLLWVD
ncbi:PP2C family protein-serine/threonine phosphatase [Mobilicoccus pelagius]|uniref:Putative serine/threonine protein phosphatase n=1 Tax=Mobilicoccus pelagius NBRC 104925 TaxID=1089455 RepID=H5UVD2_9MICO|nr:PP2C family protein-serine/threonine phosphatase [Mobilicoccus pelagius]GAB49690.1 putative serine/threonine protein phosphatase [Mobilicoccus pelagius NBRC 104925]